MTAIFSMKLQSTNKNYSNYTSTSQNNRVDGFNDIRNRKFSELDRKFMIRAMALAKRAQGKTHPNPIVGCVLVNEKGDIVGEGYHLRAGDFHAEVNALLQAGEKSRGCTAYVSLEPCNHFGRTPPCSTALVRGGIKRVVAGMLDPDPRVSGKGLERLLSSNVAVDFGLEEKECQRINKAFICRILNKQPYCNILKSVCSADQVIKLLKDENMLDIDTIVVLNGYNNTYFLEKLSALLSNHITILKPVIVSLS